MNNMLEILVAIMASPAFPDEIDIPICRFPSGRFIEEGDLSPTVHQHGAIQEFLRGTAALLTQLKMKSNFLTQHVELKTS